MRLHQKTNSDAGISKKTTESEQQTLTQNTYTLSSTTDLLLILALIVGVFLFLVLYINFFLSLNKSRRYIKMEMSRSVDKEEYLYWKHELKMLYINRIPVARAFVKRRHNKKRKK